MSAAEPMPKEMPDHAKMAKARRAVHSDRVADAERGRARTAALPPLSSMVHKRDRAELAMTVAEAADLVGVTQQAINQLINRGSLPAYRADGKRWVLVVDLVESAPARRQAAQEAEQAWLEALSRERHENPWPVELGGPFPCPDWCTVCERARAGA
jgi:excisionase family DNA binding protein